MAVKYDLFNEVFLEYAIEATYTFQGFSGYDVFGDPIKTEGFGGNLIQKNGGGIVQKNGGTLLIETGASLITFLMVVQPFTPQELDQMPKGTELTNTLKFYTNEIIPIDDAIQSVTNILIKDYKGKDYRVVSREPWENSFHLKYLCMEDRFDTA